MKRTDLLNEFQRTEFPKRVAQMDAAEPGFAAAWDALEERLCSIGGHVVVPQYETLAGVSDLLERGGVCDAASIELRPGRRNACHANAAALWFNSQGSAVMWSGYVLSDDGLWRQHSWNVQEGVLIESTEVRMYYFGVQESFVKSAAAVAERCDTGMLSGAGSAFAALVAATLLSMP